MNMDIEKRKNLYLSGFLISAIAFLLLFFFSGVSIWLLFTVILWVIFYRFLKKRLDNSSFSIFPDVLLFVLLGLVSFMFYVFSIFGFSSINIKKPNVAPSATFFESSDTQKMEVFSDTGDVVGHMRITPQKTYYLVEYAFLIEDASIKNNAKCIDFLGTWCENPQNRKETEIKYQYVVALSGADDAIDYFATSLNPVYCNKAVFEEEPYTIDNTRFHCDFNKLENWRPATTFTAINRAAVEDASLLLGAEKLVIYDASPFHEIVSETVNGEVLVKEEDVEISVIVANAFKVKEYPVEVSVSQ
jgi:hypothetical protein